MKLILCSYCYDVVSLLSKSRTCDCGGSWGRYLEDNLHAEIGGGAVPLGFSNPDFRRAVRNQPESGEGEYFTAFVIPRVCDTVRVLGGGE